MKKEARELKESYIHQIKSQYSGNIILGDVSIDIKIFHGDKRQRDRDNYHKLSMDSLEGVMLENDSQIKKAIVEVCYDKENPRIEIEIYKQEGLVYNL